MNVLVDRGADLRVAGVLSAAGRPLSDSAQLESAAAALGVETPASREVAVNELGVLAYRAEDPKCFGSAETHSLLRRVRLHTP